MLLEFNTNNAFGKTCFYKLHQTDWNKFRKCFRAKRLKYKMGLSYFI